MTKRIDDINENDIDNALFIIERSCDWLDFDETQLIMHALNCDERRATYFMRIIDNACMCFDLIESRNVYNDTINAIVSLRNALFNK